MNLDQFECIINIGGRAGVLDLLFSKHALMNCATYLRKNVDSWRHEVANTNTQMLAWKCDSRHASQMGILGELVLFIIIDTYMQFMVKSFNFLLVASWWSFVANMICVEDDIETLEVWIMSTSFQPKFDSGVFKGGWVFDTSCVRVY